jgi:hypothetical protein
MRTKPAWVYSWNIERLELTQIKKADDVDVTWPWRAIVATLVTPLVETLRQSAGNPQHLHLGNDDRRLAPGDIASGKTARLNAQAFR